MPPLSWTVTTPPSLHEFLLASCTDPLPREYLVAHSSSPYIRTSHRARFEFSLDWCKAVLRLSSHTFSSMTHSSGLLAASTASMWQSFISLLRTESKILHMNCCCKHRFAQRTANNQLFYSEVTWKAFWFSTTASLVWGFLQPSNNSARHIVLIFFCKLANRSWQCISLPTVAHKTLCFMKNNTAKAKWDGRSQAGLHPPCGFCVFTTGQYNIFNNKTVK